MTLSEAAPVTAIFLLCSPAPYMFYIQGPVKEIVRTPLETQITRRNDIFYAQVIWRRMLKQDRGHLPSLPRRPKNLNVSDEHWQGGGTSASVAGLRTSS